MPQTYLEQLTHFTNFLAAYVHTLLYLRKLYPETSFIRTRFHNTPIYQSRHPDVCEWIRDAISAVRDELLAGTVSRIGIVIFYYGGNQATGSPKIMERYMLDVSQFPTVSKSERTMPISYESHSPNLSPASSPASPSPSDDEQPQPPGQVDKDKGKEKAKDLPLDEEVEVDTSEQFRAALVLLNSRCSQLAALPQNCSFNVTMELKDEPDIDPPVGHPQPWVPVQPSLQKTGRKVAHAEDEDEDQGAGMAVGSREEGKDLGGAKVTPIRTVEAGVFRFEAWVEEGKGKFEVLEAAKGKGQGRADDSFSSSVG